MADEIRFVLRIPNDIYETIRRISYEKHKSMNRIIVDLLSKELK